MSTYSIELTGSAERVYVRLHAEASACEDSGDTTNAKVTRFRMVEEMLDKIIPHDPFAPQRSLSGPLSGLFRVKKSRLRICHAGSSAARRIVILFIAETPRKEGDSKDPYVLFTKLVTSGKYDPLLESLGMRRSKKGGKA